MKKIINVGGQTLAIVYEEFDEKVDLDSLLKIDYSNLMGEIITFPIIVNRFGLLLADAESAVAEAKLTLEIYEAKAKERFRVQLMGENGGKNPTVDALNSAVIQDKGYQQMKRKYIDAQKVRDYLNSAFWSAKDKSAKLDKLSLTIQDGELPDEVLERRVNGIKVKKVKKTIE
jgi:hypothetical protein